ncbi:MAG: DUF87 domain-containing protein [Zestosphaera sp.]
MSTRVGLTYAWRDGNIYVVVAGESYRPGIGDILYVRVSDGYTLLQVSGFEGEIPVATSSLLAREGFSQHTFSVEKTAVAKASLLFEIREVKSGSEVRRVVVKPSQPPPLDTPAYLLRAGDPESEEIMRVLSAGIPKEGLGAIPVAWLRAGIAPLKELRQEKYFRSANLKLKLHDAVSKHVLVSGQTGSGKTTSVMGLVTQWGRFGNDSISWLIIDRHGEYSRPDGFIGLLNKALSVNENLRNSPVRIYVYELRTVSEGPQGESEGLRVVRKIGGLNASSINMYDVTNTAGLSDTSVSELSEIASILAALLRGASEGREGREEIGRGLGPQRGRRIDKAWVNLFIDENDEPTGNLLALIPLITSNVVRYEGVGEREKKGIYRVLVNAGIYVNRLRDYRRLIRATLGLSERQKFVVTGGGKGVGVSVIDDGNSVFKVSPVLKNPLALIELLNALVNSSSEVFGTSPGSYPWKDVEGEKPSELASNALDLEEMVQKLNSGAVVVLDVSRLPVSLGDIVAMSVLRRLFEGRMQAGVDASKGMPVVAVVSEEAPLYLSPEKISSPYNIFARLAREGRKFGIGLIALSQIATQIERQILANFNTIIALRTKHRTDIDYLINIGVPAEALPSLSDREGYLYTPDLNVSEPIPVYMPAYFDYSEEVEKDFRDSIKREEVMSRVASMFRGEGVRGGEDTGG